MFGLSIRFQPRPDYSRLAEKARREANAVLRELGPQLVLLLKQQFQSGTNPYGTPWVPLKESTVRKKRNKGYANPEGILLATQYLFNSGLRYQVREGRLRVFASTVDNPAYAESSEYAGFHQTGGGRLPRRQIFPDHDHMPTAWRDTINAQLIPYARRVFRQ